MGSAFAQDLNRQTLAPDTGCFTKPEVIQFIAIKHPDATYLQYPQEVIFSSRNEATTDLYAEFKQGGWCLEYFELRPKKN